MKKRILFLMSDTGGGHRAAALAIEEAIHHLYPETYQTYVEDVWKHHTPWPVNKIPNTYAWLTGPGLPLWRLMWSGLAYWSAHHFVIPGISPVLERKMLRYLDALRPDVMVSVHPLMNHLGLKWLRKLQWDIPFVTVVTDMVTIHPLWICPKVTCCLVPTELAREKALRFGMNPDKVEVVGQPVGLKFGGMSPNKEAARRLLGLDLGRRTVLVMGGGEGFGPVFEIARKIAGTVPLAQLLVVAGRNQALKDRLEAATWEIPTRIYGFTNQMPELMRAADVVITKAGPGTISEAFIAGVPPLISGYIPGQEKGNVTYVQEHHAGAYAETPAEIAHLISDWFMPNNPTLDEMTGNAARLARPEASLKIAAKVCSLIGNQTNLEVRSGKRRVAYLAGKIFSFSSK